MTDKICLLKYKLLAIQNGNIYIYLKCKRVNTPSFVDNLQKIFQSCLQTGKSQEQMSIVIFK